MPEHPEHSQNTSKPVRTFLDKLASFISSEPDSRTELLDILHDAHDRKLIDTECLSMIEGVFRLFDSAVRDVMIPRSQMYVIEHHPSPARMDRQRHGKRPLALPRH